MFLLKLVGSIVIVAAALLVVVANFSGVESRFECVGTAKGNDAERRLTIFVKLVEYRWWVGLWSGSHGSLLLEIPNEYVGYYSHVRRVGDQLQIYLDAGGQLHGNFSTLSNILALDSRASGFFDGRCGRIAR
jgi:hypothetical protein